MLEIGVIFQPLLNQQILPAGGRREARDQLVLAEHLAAPETTKGVRRLVIPTLDAFPTLPPDRLHDEITRR